MAATRAALATEKKKMAESPAPPSTTATQSIPAKGPQADEREEISRLAYGFWEERQGTSDGSPEDDWLRAEREYYSRQNARQDAPRNGS